jgi:hypothetical protein
MQINVAYGGLSGTSVTMDVDPEVTAVGILNGLKGVDGLDIDPAKETYVVSVRGKTLPAEGTLQSANVKSGDLLVVSRSETGY